MMRYFIVSVFLMILVGKSVVCQDFKMLLPEAGELEKVYNYTNHSLSYNTSYRLCSWVSYKLSANQIGNEDVTIKMTSDPNITFRAAEKKDYKKSGYEAAQFMSSVSVANNKKALEESFYLSNFMPVKPAFNKFVWKGLDELISYWAKDGDLQIITGPVLTESPYATIGDNKVIVPKTVYKIVYSPSKQEAVGFLIKSTVARGAFNTFVKPIDEIEEITGIDFLHELPDDIENEIEKHSNADNWVWEIE